MGGSGELHPELWRDAPVVRHDVLRDGADVQRLLERWARGGPVKGCFPPGLPRALAEIGRLRTLWSQRYRGAEEFAVWFADWTEAKIRAEYGPGARVPPARDHRLRRGVVPRRRRERTSCTARRHAPVAADRG